MSHGATRINSILVERGATAEEIAVRAAELVCETLGSKPDAALLLPAGATPIPLYAELRRRHAAGEIDLAAARAFQLDELVGVAPSDPRSFHAFLRQHYADPLPDAAPVHLLTGDAPDPAAEIHRHTATLERQGGADVAVLGIGTNGHIAFNEPGSDADAPARVVTLAEGTRAALRKHFADDALPSRGITLGVREILRARHILLLATGGSKAEVVRDLVRGGATPDLPASLLGEHPDFLVLCDEEAGRLL